MDEHRLLAEFRHYFGFFLLYQWYLSNLDLYPLKCNHYGVIISDDATLIIN
jgi:hypothetical protein